MHVSCYKHRFLAIYALSRVFPDFFGEFTRSELGSLREDPARVAPGLALDLWSGVFVLKSNENRAPMPRRRRLPLPSGAGRSC